jgi:putative ABC transport system permease protein
MLIAETIQIALSSIRDNFFRAALTMLGIIIGVAAVITMVALGTGAQRAIDEEMAALGGHILSISSSLRFSRGVAREQNTLTVKDADALMRDTRHLDGVVPEINARFQIKFGNRNLNQPIIGTTPNYFDVHGFSVAYGRLFNIADDGARRRVAVLGYDVPGLLGVQPAALIGNTLQIRAMSFEIIGVVGPKGSSGWRNPDGYVWIPLQTAQFRVTGSDAVEPISVRVRSDTPIGVAMVDIERVLRREHGILPGRDNDFSIFNRQQFLESRQEATEIFTWLLAGIAGVSLLVGGIGIMNIMLVTVTERTREIGIRKALGATRGNILLQFLVESMTLCLIGGALGLALGTGAAMFAAHFAGWQTVVTTKSVVTAFAFSAAVGLFFGIWPAQRAAKLDPIEALRYE